MPQIRPALLALAMVALLVAGPMAGALARPGTAGPAAEAAVAPAPDAPPQSLVAANPNATNYLDVEKDEVRRADYGTASLDVVAAVEMDVEQWRGKYSTYAFEASYDNVTGQAARTERLRAEVDRLESRVRNLERRYRRAVANYNAGQISTERFLRKLAVLDAAVDTVTQQFENVRRAGGFGLLEELETRLRSLEPKLLTLQGQVRGNVGRAMTGQRQPMSVYALTSDTGIVLSTTDGAVFNRSAYLAENREPVGPDRFVTEEDPSGITAANDRARELYPWTYANGRPSVNVPFRTTSVYRVSLDHAHGVLEAYLDGTTRDVFREFQTKRTPVIPTETTTNTTDALSLRVNRTYGTGPMEVTVTDPATGEPVDATIEINGYRVGSTGGDGRLWTVTPHDAVRITARADGEIVRVRFFAE
ncbi:MAG: hypothetical protein ABEJ40_00775 [Haloarculaceae archaeon]